MYNIWPRILGKFRNNYVEIGNSSCFLLLVVGSLDYVYRWHGCDLLWWRYLFTRMTPLYTMAAIAASKLILILGLVLYSYLSPMTKGVQREERNPEDMPIAHVRRRFCYFIMMRMMASLSALIESPVEELEERHMAFCMAVNTFRFDARKLFERTDLQLNISLHEVLVVDESVEDLLIEEGHGEKLQNLRELDIYRMVYDT
ncbi:hypothetical protein KR018_011961 [Drosophila ironensis]|nr:hypothetical protein KR018_011961 [Drosophila ironensis]